MKYFTAIFYFLIISSTLFNLTSLNAQYDSSFIRAMNVGYGFHSGGPYSIFEHKDGIAVTFSYKLVAGGKYGQFPYLALYDKEGFLLKFIPINTQHYFSSIDLYESYAWIKHTFDDGRILLQHFTRNMNHNVSGWLMFSPDNQILWHNFIYANLMYINDSVALGLVSIPPNRGADFIYCIRLSDGFPVWSFEVPDTLKSYYSSVDGYSGYYLLDIYQKNNLSYVLIENWQNPCQKYHLKFDVNGFQGLEAENDCYQMRWIFDKYPFVVKKYPSQPVSSSSQRNENIDPFKSFLIIQDSLGNVITKFDKNDPTAGYSFKPMNLWPNPDSSLTVFFQYKWDTASTFYYGMLNFSVNGQINWCRDYYPLDLRRLTSGNGSTPIRLSDGGYLFVTNDKYLMKTDPIGRVLKSDIGITFTRNYCDHIHEVKEVLSENIPALYPNPNNGIFYLHTGGNGFYQIIDLTGRILYEKPVSQAIESIDLSHLASAMYILRYFSNENEVFSSKFVKK